MIKNYKSLNQSIRNLISKNYNQLPITDAVVIIKILLSTLSISSSLQYLCSSLLPGTVPGTWYSYCIIYSFKREVLNDRYH